MYVYIHIYTRVAFGKDPRIRKTVAGNLEFSRVTATENIVPLSDERAMETTSVRVERGNAKIYPGTISALGSTRYDPRVCVCVYISAFDEGWEILRARKRVQRPRNSQRSLLLSFTRLTEGNPLFASLPILLDLFPFRIKTYFVVNPSCPFPHIFLFGFRADTMFRIRGRE